jgi:hypothetical protein
MMARHKGERMKTGHDEAVWMVRNRELLLASMDKADLLDASPAELAKRRSCSFSRTALGGNIFFYPRSVFRADGILFFIGGSGHGLEPADHSGSSSQPGIPAHPGIPTQSETKIVPGSAAAYGNGGKRLFLVSTDKIPAGFTGVRFSAAGRHVFEGECSFENYLAAKEYLPFMAPISLRNKQTTLGCGDRVGLAGPGHIRAFQGFNISPVLAQLSMRELKLTGRTYPLVVKDAAFAALQEGFENGFGADGDHLKNITDINIALDTGMPMITLDLSEVMNPAPADWTDSAIIDAFANLPESVQALVMANYAGKSFNIAGTTINMPPTEAKRCALMYWKALDFSVQVDQHLRSRRGDAYDLEISIDETTAPTIPAHHLFIAAELKRRAVTLNSLAPRFTGEFQKGVDYIGDIAEFERQFIVHCDIARTFGDYKISIHSGSDKFSVYPIIGKHTALRVHVKTAGTSWLQALRGIALHDPDLFRNMLNKAYQYFPDALKLYHITADLSRIPPPASIADQNLSSFLDIPESRQLMHVTYGGLLNDPDHAPEFFRFLAEREEVHYNSVSTHIRKHIELLGTPRKG